MSDLIRRQDAIAVLSILADKMDSTGKTVMEQAIEVIRDLRSAQKTGEPLKISKTVNREEFENIIKNSPMMLITPGTEKIELIREQQWIPCSERLPEVDKGVFVYIYDMPFIAWVDKNGEWNTETFTLDKELEKDDEPIAWIPLPSQYKGE